MSITRLTSTVGAGAVAAIAGWSSWSHMVAVALHYGEKASVAYVLPVSVDGLLVVASAALVDDKRNGRKGRWSARVAFAMGICASVAANVMHAEPSLPARLIAAWPALALLATVELLSRAGKHRAQVSPEPSPQPTAVRRSTAVSAGRTRRGRNVRRPQAQSRQMLAELLADDPTLSPESLGRTMKISPRRVRQLLAAE